jgi:hypothetical protein
MHTVNVYKPNFIPGDAVNARRNDHLLSPVATVSFAAGCGLSCVEVRLDGASLPNDQIVCLAIT